MKRITIRDIAKMLDISPSTVSRALSDHPDISVATKNRVKEVAKAFNYTVNLHSNFFRNKKSNLIALILPEINMFFTPSLIKAINKVLSKTEYSLFIMITEDRFLKEEEMIEQCIKWAVEGVLISLSSETKNIAHLEQLNNFGINTVLLDRILSNQIIPTVSSDSFGSSYKATEHLMENGHRRILGIFGNPNLSITKQRISGFNTARLNWGLPSEDSHVITVNKVNSLDDILPEVLEQNNLITAISVMSDELLARTQFVLHKMGKRIYHDYSLVAISDGAYPDIIFPNVTYIKDSGKRIGKKAIRLLVDLIEGKRTSQKLNVQVKTKLVLLDSVKNINPNMESS